MIVCVCDEYTDADFSKLNNYILISISRENDDIQRNILVCVCVCVCMYICVFVCVYICECVFHNVCIYA